MLHDDTGKGTGEPDRRSYQAVFDVFYRGVFDAGLQARIAHPTQVFAEDPTAFAVHHPVLIAAGLLIATDEHLAWLDRYAAAGGHLVLGPATATTRPAHAERKPALLTDASGVWYDEFSTIERPVPTRATAGSPLDIPTGTHAPGGSTACRQKTPRYWQSTSTRTSPAGPPSPPEPTRPGASPTSAPSPTTRRPPRSPAGSHPDATWRPASPGQTVTGATAHHSSGCGSCTTGPGNPAASRCRRRYRMC